MKLATEVMDEATADCTIDEVLRRDPSNLTQEDYKSLIESLRVKRAMFIEQGEKKQAKKQGIEETDDADSE